MTNQDIIAVDIAILPPLDIIDKIISINRQAAIKNLAWGSLGKDDFLPHLSLAMGGIKKESLETVRNIVEDVVKQFIMVEVELYELYYAEKPDGSRNYCIRAKNTPVLQKLHENLMNNLRQYFSYDCTGISLFSKPGEETTEPHYINNYLESHSFEAYDPHITLRIKEPVGQEYLPIKFTAIKVAACHVGITTTCRKVLFSIDLRAE